MAGKLNSALVVSKKSKGYEQIMDKTKKNTNFQLEIISESLRELQQEKRKLENFLDNEQARRKDTETKLNLVNARYSNVQERYSRLSATRDIARQKMYESKELINRLQRLHVEKQNLINDTREKINLGKRRREEMSTEFAQQLQNLAKTFFSAREEYNEVKLHGEQKDLEKKIQETKNAVQESKQTIDELTEEFSKIKVEEEKQESRDDWPTVDEVQMVLEMFEEEANLGKETLDKSEVDLKFAREKLELLKERSKELGISSEQAEEC
ncbi:uncharacterized protein LOC135681213 [Rhopilema esculentum]|uniref:uncharacterized protein LOC135681213 n=1 Tax=Rhopilema esculentum TaxID=499914 RepID=UPI0031D79115|eukprot:gene13440-4311_t